MKNVNVDEHGDKQAEKKMPKNIQSMAFRRRRISAKCRKVCFSCGYEVRGTNHIKGSHHITGKAAMNRG